MSQWTRLTKADDIHLLRFIVSYQKVHGSYPTYREVRDELKLKSISPVQHRINRLVEKGWLEIRPNTARGMRVKRRGLVSIREWEDMINRRVQRWKGQHE